MTYTINVKLGGVQFGIIEETYEDALAEFAALGGNADLLGKMIPDAFESVLEGPTEPARSARPAPTRSSKPASEDADWNSDGPWSGSEGSAKPERTDPWDDEPVADSKPARTRSGPSRGNSRPAQTEEAAGEVQNKVDKFGRTWTLGLPDAPNCHCGVPAARMKGKGRDSGKSYTKFKCAKGAPDGDWRDKCDYDEFPPR